MLKCRIFAKSLYFMKYSIIIFVILGVLGFSSCANQYEALYRSTDNELKYKKAIEYYEAGKYTKAQQLFDQIQMVFRGTAKDDTLQYYLALSNYNLNDYVLAEDNFNQFAQMFPRSPFTKTARFLRLDCLYESTYRYELDQNPSQKAIAAVEEFLYDFPGNEYTQVCRYMLEDLYNRLDKKGFESAKIYYVIEDYKASTYALKEALKQNPESRYREDILYYVVASNFKYASNSIPQMQRERFLNVIDEYYNFISEFPDSKYRKEVDTMFKKAQQVTTRNNKSEEENG